MDNEVIEIARIDAKIEKGESLTNAEENKRAYSPFGTAGGCHVCSASGMVKPTVILSEPPSMN